MMTDKFSVGLFILLFVTAVCGQTNDVDSKEKVLKAFDKITQAKSVIMETVATNEYIAKSSLIVTRFIAPDRTHVVWSSLDRKKVLIESITIGEFEYTKESGVWKKEPVNALTKFANAIQNFVECSRENYILNVQKINLNDLKESDTSVFKYDYDVKSIAIDSVKAMGLTVDKTLLEREDEMKVKVRINHDGLIVKYESVRTIGGTGKPEVLRKSTTYKYNELFSIEPPNLSSKQKRIAKHKKKNER